MCIVLFFCEFFGYLVVSKVFKDGVCIGGIYCNFGWGMLVIFGWLIYEVDCIVIWYVEYDENVFENLFMFD